MLTREVREWMQKVERGQYSYDDAMSYFVDFMRFLTKEEIIEIKNRLKNIYKN